MLSSFRTTVCCDDASTPEEFSRNDQYPVCRRWRAPEPNDPTS